MNNIIINVLRTLIVCEHQSFSLSELTNRTAEQQNNNMKQVQLQGCEVRMFSEVKLKDKPNKNCSSPLVTDQGSRDKLRY